MKIYNKIGIILMFLSFLFNCKISTPFKKFNTTIPKDQIVIIGLTYIEVGKESHHTKIFWNHVFSIKDSIQENDGILGISIRRELFGNRGWTMTIWKDEDSLDSFVEGKRHRIAMKEGMPALIKTKFLRIERRYEEIPIAWKEVEKLLEDLEDDKTN
jgi:heme-degrading monooxygenase HmoA